MEILGIISAKVEDDVIIRRAFKIGNDMIPDLTRCCAVVSAGSNYHGALCALMKKGRKPASHAFVEIFNSYTGSR